MSKQVVKKEGADLIQSAGQASDFESALLKIVERTDIDPERLEKFLDLHAKMQSRAAQVEFFSALAGFQGDCPIIKRTRKVDFENKSGLKTKYNYAPLDEIVHVIKPHLDKWGLSYSFNVRKTELKEENELLVTVRHRAGHSETTSHYYNPLHDDTRMNSSQRAKSSITYAKRAALENALGVVTAEEDDDANRAIDAGLGVEQLDEIKTLLRQTGSDEKKFLAFMKVDSLEQMTAYEAKKAIHALKQKRGK